jgi:hypothetical protein
MPIGTDTVTATYNGDNDTAASFNTVSQTVVGSAATSTTLTASAASVVANVGVSFTATVSPISGTTTPTGTVTFTDSTTGATLGVGTLIGGVATIQAALGAPLGTHTVVAAYNPTTGFAASTSAGVPIAVVANGTRTSKVTVASSQSPSDVGQSVTFTVTVKDTGSTPAKTPTGTVAFLDNGTLIGYGDLTTSGGVTTARFSTTSLTVGTSSITAVYSGSPTFALATSAAISQVEINPTRTSNTTLGSSASPSVYGTSVTFTATVKDTGSGAVQTPTGTVTFFDVTTNALLGVGTLTSTVAGTATATFSTPATALQAGNQDVTATYGGNTVFAQGNVASFTQVVKQVGSTTVLKSSLTTTAVYGQSVTLTATIKPTSGSGVPTGTVTFYQNGNPIGNPVSVTTTSGVTTAVLKTTALAVGSDGVYAVYNGDVNVSTSTSTTVVQTVKQASTSIALTTLTTTTTVTFTATITPVSPGSGEPSGTVNFYVDGNFVGTGTVNALTGQASFTYEGIYPVGNHTLKAVYSGDTDFLGLTKSITFAGGRGT